MLALGEMRKTNNMHRNSVRGSKLNHVKGAFHENGYQFQP
jgi:hypothetical protein